MYAVATGEMFDSIDFYGPFDEFEDAEKWAITECSYTWWIVKLLSPEEA